MEPRGSDNLRATSSENGSISKPIRPLSGRQRRMLASNPPNEDASKGSSRGDKSRSTKGGKKVSFATADAGSSNENSMTSTQGTKFPAGTVKVAGSRDSMAIEKYSRMGVSSYGADSWPTLQSSYEESETSARDTHVPNGRIKVPDGGGSISTKKFGQYRFNWHPAPSSPTLRVEEHVQQDSPMHSKTYQIRHQSSLKAVQLRLKKRIPDFPRTFSV